jgi:hypothetical protein
MGSAQSLSRFAGVYATAPSGNVNFLDARVVVSSGVVCMIGAPKL